MKPQVVLLLCALLGCFLEVVLSESTTFQDEFSTEGGHRDQRHTWNDVSKVNIEVDTTNNGVYSTESDNVYSTGDGVLSTSDDVHSSKNEVYSTKREVYSTNDEDYTTRDDARSTKGNVYSSSYDVRSTNDGVDSGSRYETTVREQTITADDFQNTTVDQPEIGCTFLNVFPKQQSLPVGNNATFMCICVASTNFTSPGVCPMWKDTKGLKIRNITFENKCISIAEIANISSGSGKRLVCEDINSHKLAIGVLEVKRSRYDGKCLLDEECLSPYECQESVCGCPDKKPIFIASSTNKCHPLRKLLSSCLYSLQCGAKVHNAYCHRDPKHSSEPGICLCADGYKIQNGTCVSSGAIYTRVYNYARRYHLIIFAFLAFCFVFIFLGLLRICMVRKRDLERRTGRTIPSSSVELQPYLTEKKSKF